MMPTKRSPKAPSSIDIDTLFTKELAGETPPSRATLELLYRLAVKLHAVKPWDLLGESALVLTRDPATGEMCYCGATGQLGEDVAVRAYIGGESYRLLYGLAAAGTVQPMDFLFGQRSVSVEFARRGDLDPKDKKLLDALGHPSTAKASPMFRSIRPGYQPWFVTEAEGLLLAQSMRAMLLVCTNILQNPDVDYWQGEDTFPLVSEVGEDGGAPTLKIDLIQAPVPDEAPLAPAVLSADQLSRLRAAGRSTGAVELDLFHGTSAIGGTYERKAWVRMAVAADAASGNLLPPVLPEPDVRTADVLAEAILNVTSALEALPGEVRVLNQKFKDCLQPIADVCGLRIKVVRSLPKLARARKELMPMLGGFGFPEL